MSWNKIIECVPNFSEGRDLEKIDQIVAPFRIKAGVKLLDYSNDEDHNRLVVTLVGEPEALYEAIVEAVGVAVRLIDLNQHTGQHPRMGAVDVIPFIPIKNTSMEDRETDNPEHLPNKLGFASERPGFMHACGHDGHTAVGLAVAHWLVMNKDRLCGRFILIFQPAEEGVRGARAMAASGLVDHVDYFLGGHVGGDAKLGEIAVMDGGFLASTKFDVSIEGTPAHAGNSPELGHSALMAACAASLMIQGIPRNSHGETRVSVGKLEAGEGRNVIPAHAKLQMEVRGETMAVNQFMADYVYDIFAGVDKAYRVKSTVTKAGESETLMPCPEIYPVLEKVMAKIPGTKLLPRVHSGAGSEDCALFIRRVIEHGGKAGFVLYGCNHHGHHRPDFEIQDEISLPIAFRIFTGFAEEVNGLK